MRIINHSFNSKFLGYETAINVIIPTNNISLPPYKVLYLLHGAHGNENDWITNTNISQLVDKYGLIIVCPRGEQSYYTNAMKGPQYESYIAIELKEFIENNYVVSKNKENNFIAGLSMGGYGALKIAFNNLEKFSTVGCFSGVVDVAKVTPHRDNSVFRFDLTFGDITKLKDSKHDLFKLSSDIINSTKPQINTFIICGTEDHLYNDNKNFIKHLHSIKYKYTYMEFPGEHDWPFWNASIIKFLQFIFE